MPARSIGFDKVLAVGQVDHAILVAQVPPNIGNQVPTIAACHVAAGHGMLEGSDADHQRIAVGIGHNQSANVFGNSEQIVTW